VSTTDPTRADPGEAGPAGAVPDGAGEDGSELRAGPDVRSWWRRSRLLVLLVLLVVLTGIALAVGRGGERTGLLDPAATDPSGSRALAVLLTDRGTPVARVVGTAAAAARVPTSGATVLVAEPAAVPASALRRLARLGGSSRIVLVGADVAALAALGVDIRPRSPAVQTRSRQPRCALGAARTAGSVQLGG